MRLLGLTRAALAPLAAIASAQDQQPTAIDGAAYSSGASALVSNYIPPSVYAQLTASVAAAASAASVTGDPGSLFFSAIMAPTPPAWFSSAVPSPFTSNVAALESAISELQPGATVVSGSASVVVGTTTNSLGSTVTTSFTSTLPTSTGSGSSESSTDTDSKNHAAPTMGPGQLAGAGIAALVGLVAAV